MPCSRRDAAGAGWSLDAAWIDISRRIDVDKSEHLELLRKTGSLKTDLHRFLDRRAIGAENLVPQRPVGIVASMHVTFMMQNVLLGASRGRWAPRDE